MGNHSNMKKLHAKYFLDEEYKKKIDKEWEELDETKRNKIITFLKKLGYCDKVIIDEYQAYPMNRNRNSLNIFIIRKNI